MGTPYSLPTTPPPLVSVSAPGGKVLVPPYTSFSVHPARRHDRVYYPARRPRAGRRRPGADVLFVDEEEDWGSESDLEGEDMGGPMSPRMGRGYAGRMSGGGGVGMGGRRGGQHMFDGGFGRPGSAPERHMGGYPGMGGMHSPRMGGMNSPRMGGMPGMGPGGLHEMGPGEYGGMRGGPMGGMGGMNNPMGPGHSDLPPGYTPMPSMPYYGGNPGGAGNMPGGNPYAYPGPPPSPPSSTGSASQEHHAPHRPQRSPSNGAHKHIPMGAFATGKDSPKLHRRHTSPSTADRLNRKQSSGAKVGPSGKEWLAGDAFLDACTCTTNCTCRSGHRVLYRSRSDPVGSETESTSPRYESGEIRYILKDDLGRDCGDHSGCVRKRGSRSGSGSSEGSDEEGRKKEKERKKEEKKRKEEFKGLKEDIIEALDEKIEKMKKERKAKSSSSVSVGSPRLPFAGMGGAGMNRFGMGDPNLGQKMGMGSGGGMGLGMDSRMNMPNNPYTMNDMPDPRFNRQTRAQMQMPMGPMGRGMPFEDDMSMADMDGMGMGMGMGMVNPYQKNQRQRSRFIPPGGLRRGGASGYSDVDPMAYFTRGRARGGAGLSGYRPRGVRPRMGYTSDELDYDLGPRRQGIGMGLNKRRGGGNSAGEDAFGEMPGDSDEDNEADQAPKRRGTSPPPNRLNPGRSTRDRTRQQPRADTDDDDGRF